MTTHYIELPSRAVLRISGEDAESFLQGLISNDIKKVTDERSIYAALLTPQGKFLADFIIAREGDAYLFDVERERLADLMKRLSIYRLRSKVQFEDISDSYGVTALLSDQIFERGATRHEGDVIIINDPRHEQLGQRLMGPVAQTHAWLLAHGAEPAPLTLYETHRLALGIPDGSRDIEVERGILLEHGFEELHGVDFEKGCYVGQEVTARSKHRAELKKGLYVVRGDTPLPASGTPITCGTTEIGVLRSTLEKTGLALLRHAELNVALGSGEPVVAGHAKLAFSRPAWKTL